MIADPFRLYDCCLETDGAAAMIVAPAEVARDFPNKPVYLAGSVQGSGHRQLGVVDGFWHPDFVGSNYSTMVDRLYAAAGMGPEEIDLRAALRELHGSGADDDRGPQVLRARRGRAVR